jgi:putative transposase
MSKETTDFSPESRACWENLESWVREQVQVWLQELLEQEVTELLGRVRHQRRSAVDSQPGYRNGYGKPRKLTLSCGTLTVRRPRVRGLEERFESRLLPLFVKRSRQVAELIPELYLHGLAEGDFDLALRGLLGEEAPLSASTVARMKKSWQGEWEVWKSRRLDDLEPVYVWVDGVYVKAGLEKEKAAVLVVLAALSDGTKRVLSIAPGYRESEAGWSGVLRDLKARGLKPPRLVIGDGNLGIWAALANVWPEVEEQRCWNHKILNVLDKLPKSRHAEAKPLLCPIPYAESLQQAERRCRLFQRWCRQQGYEAAAECLERDWDRLVTFYRFPKAQWQHLRTTNPVESPFAALRLRTAAAKRFKKVENATAVIWKMLLVAESRFRRLRSPELTRAVYYGAAFENGLRTKVLPEEAAA